MIKMAEIFRYIKVTNGFVFKVLIVRLPVPDNQVDMKNYAAWFGRFSPMLVGKQPFDCGCSYITKAIDSAARDLIVSVNRNATSVIVDAIDIHF